jgi:hypothetical protein
MDEDQLNEETTAVLAAGSVEYSAEVAAVEIDDLIALLEEMKSEGATHVVQSSGNYRGARWASIGAGWSWMGE